MSLQVRMRTTSLGRKSLLAAGLLVLSGSAVAQSFIGPLKQVSTVASTIPANGDVNPYGVARIRRSVGALVQGNILVSNFNNGKNLQGTGTTIVEITPTGAVTQFAQIDAATLPGACPGGVGLTTALVVLSRGWVIVGSLPTADGTAATAKAGCLIVLNSMGKVVETFSGGVINGPWDMTSLDLQSVAVLFFTNVLNGTVAANGTTVNHGTVVRMVLNLNGAMPHRVATTVIGTSFPERTDPAALVVGPTGVGLNLLTDTLYVADSAANRIAAIHGALVRRTASVGGVTVASKGKLNDPLGLTLTPGGHILTANGNDGNLVETTPTGKQIAVKAVDTSGSPPGAGTLFGLVAVPHQGVYFVDDGTNTLNLLH